MKNLIFHYFDKFTFDLVLHNNQITTLYKTTLYKYLEDNL